MWAAPEPRRAGKDSSREGCALERLADRLLDWFSVLMDDAGAHPPPRDGNSFARTGRVGAQSYNSRTTARSGLRGPKSYTDAHFARTGFPRDCKPEVRWMFTHLDTDGDGLLSAHDLYALREYRRELREYRRGRA